MTMYFIQRVFLAAMILSLAARRRLQALSRFI